MIAFKARSQAIWLGPQSSSLTPADAAHDSKLTLAGLPLLQDKVRVTQQAVQIVNLAHNTTLSLQYPPQTLGLGCLYFVFKHLNCEVSKESPLFYLSTVVKRAYYGLLHAVIDIR